MEANVMAANAAPSLAPRGRPPNPNTINDRASSQTRVPVSPQPAAAPNVQEAERQPPPLFVNLAPSVEMLSVHHAISPGVTEELITLDIPTPFTDAEITDTTISRYVSSVNEALAPSFFRLNISVHDATNMLAVQVIDVSTDEVLREIPPESRLELMARIQEFAGLLFDDRG